MVSPRNATGSVGHAPTPVRSRWQRTGGEMASERDLNEVRFLTVAEVASMMRVSKMTVYRLVHSGEMPAVRVGRSFRVPEQAVDDYLRDSFVDTA
jgi:excisionase family DNA binding protein